MVPSGRRLRLGSRDVQPISAECCVAGDGAVRSPSGQIREHNHHRACAVFRFNEDGCLVCVREEHLRLCILEAVLLLDHPKDLQFTID